MPDGRVSHQKNHEQVCMIEPLSCRGLLLQEIILHLEQVVKSNPIASGHSRNRPRQSSTRHVLLSSLLLQDEIGIEGMNPKARDAIARSTTVLVLICVVAVASTSAVVYLNYFGPGCGNVSGNGFTTGAVVLADYLSVPTGGTYNGSGRDWQFIIGNLGSVGIKSACASLTTGTGKVIQTAPGVPPDGSTSVWRALASGVQPGRSYPVNITVVYDNGDSQLLRSSVQAIATASSPGTAKASILNDSLYLPSANGTETSDAFWTYVVGNTGTVTVTSITASPGLEPSDALTPTFLTNIVPGDTKSTGAGLLMAAFNIQAGETYAVTFLVYYANGQTENISTSVTAETV